MKNLIVIPARYQSTRLPGKPLLKISEKSMIQMVYEQSKKSALADEVIVATDDQRIVNEVESFGGKAIMTSLEHRTGTDRLVEVAHKVKADNYINVQGDEPFVDPKNIDMMIELLEKEPRADITTLCHLISKREAKKENIVKVVMDQHHRALYFSRASIPYFREESNANYYKHIGLYAYRREILLSFPKLASSSLEDAEKLEQLRFLQSGKSIYLKITDEGGPSVDTPKGLEDAREYIRLSQIERNKFYSEPNLSKVKLLITDVDGVLSPAQIIYNENGEVSKTFNVHDGFGIKVLIALGINVAVISGRDSIPLRKRLSDLNISYFSLNVKNKALECKKIMKELNVKPSETIYIGDDTIDLSAFSQCGISCTVKDASDYIKKAASIVLNKNGGEGVIREVAEMILREKNMMHYFTSEEGHLKLFEKNI